LEKKSIFESGFYDIRIDDFNKLFVAPFNNSNRRQLLAERFMLFWQKLEEIGVDFEIWIDGSFITDKKEPNDIDMAVIHVPNQVNLLSIDKKEIIKYLFSDREETKLRYYCDAYFIPNIHPAEISYWKNFFEKSRGKQDRVLARLMINVTQSYGYLTDGKILS